MLIPNDNVMLGNREREKAIKATRTLVCFYALSSKIVEKPAGRVSRKTDIHVIKQMFLRDMTFLKFDKYVSFSVSAGTLRSHWVRRASSVHRNCSRLNLHFRGLFLSPGPRVSPLQLLHPLDFFSNPTFDKLIFKSLFIFESAGRPFRRRTKADGRPTRTRTFFFVGQKLPS